MDELCKTCSDRSKQSQFLKIELLLGSGKGNSTFLCFFLVMHCCIFCRVFFVLRSQSSVTTVITRYLHAPVRICAKQLIWNMGLDLTNTPLFLLYFQVKPGTLPSLYLRSR